MCDMYVRILLTIILCNNCVGSTEKWYGVSKNVCSHVVVIPGQGSSFLYNNGKPEIIIFWLRFKKRQEREREKE